MVFAKRRRDWALQVGAGLDFVGLVSQHLAYMVNYHLQLCVDNLILIFALLNAGPDRPARNRSRIPLLDIRHCKRTYYSIY